MFEKEPKENKDEYLDKEIEEFVSSGNIVEAIDYVVENRSFENINEVIDKIINKDKEVINFLLDSELLKKDDRKNIYYFGFLIKPHFTLFDDFVSYLKDNKQKIMDNLNVEVEDKKLNFVIIVIKYIWYNFYAKKISEHLNEKISFKKNNKKLSKESDLRWIVTLLKLSNYLNWLEEDEKHKEEESIQSEGYEGVDKYKKEIAKRILFHLYDKIYLKFTDPNEKFDEKLIDFFNEKYEKDQGRSYHKKEYKFPYIDPIKTLEYFIKEFKEQGILQINKEDLEKLKK